MCRCPHLFHKPECPPHGGDKLFAGCGGQPAVFFTIWWRDRRLKPEPDAGLLGDRIADMGVGVDKGRQHDIGRLGCGLLDGVDPAVIDDDPPANRLERSPGEDRPRVLLHSSAHRLDSDRCYYRRRCPY